MEEKKKVSPSRISVRKSRTAQNQMPANQINTFQLAFFNADMHRHAHKSTNWTPCGTIDSVITS